MFCLLATCISNNKIIKSSKTCFAYKQASWRLPIFLCQRLNIYTLTWHCHYISTFPYHINPTSIVRHINYIYFNPQLFIYFIVNLSFCYLRSLVKNNFTSFDNMAYLKLNIDLNTNSKSASFSLATSSSFSVYGGAFDYEIWNKGVFLATQKERWG